MTRDRIAGALRAAGIGEVDSGERRRAEYSSDASNYRVVPRAVVFPRHADEVLTTLEVCRAQGVPLTSRGAGTPLAGNAVGEGVVLDFSRHLNRVLAVDLRKAAPPWWSPAPCWTRSPPRRRRTGCGSAPTPPRTRGRPSVVRWATTPAVPGRWPTGGPPTTWWTSTCRPAPACGSPPAGTGATGWGRLVGDLLAGDAEFASATATFDGSIALAVGEDEVGSRLYRGRIVDVAHKSLQGATFTVAADELTWVRPFTGVHDDYVRLAAAGAFRVRGSGFQYLRMTKAIRILVDRARKAVADAGDA